MAEVSKISLNGTPYDIRDKLAVLRGEGTPTSATSGAIGQIYEDTVNGILYVCKSEHAGAYTWAKVTPTQTSDLTNNSNFVADVNYVHTDNNYTSADKSDVGQIDGIVAKIPNQATASNQLADKDFVNSSINSVTAFYITKNAAGDQFATHAELSAARVFYSGGVARTPTRNDYCIVLADEDHVDSITGEAPTTRYIYQNGWEFQYVVNKTTLTAAQLAAVNSGITSTAVTKLNGIAAGAEVNVQSNWTQTNTSADDYIKNKPTNLVSDASYVHTDNNFTTTLKNKLNGIATGAEVNVQSDWSVTSTTSDAYIKNKPTIPTVNNATLTIQRNGSSVQTFTANASSNKTANIQCVTSTPVVSTESVTPVVTTDLIVDRAVTPNKIDFDSLKTQITDLIYPIGSIFMSATLSTATQVKNALGGTWAAWGAGKVPVGVNSSETEFNTVEKTGGEKTHTLTVSEMPAHNHPFQYTNNSGGSGTTKTYGTVYSSANQSVTTNDTIKTSGELAHWGTQNRGGDGAHNNLQPYITCYMYKRIS